MKCPLLAIGYLACGDKKTNKKCECLKEGCAWWDDSDEHCCIADIASSLSIVMSFLKDITENGIPRRGG